LRLLPLAGSLVAVELISGNLSSASDEADLSSLLEPKGLEMLGTAQPETRTGLTSNTPSPKARSHGRTSIRLKLTPSLA
jgi:hypothetical protein